MDVSDVSGWIFHDFCHTGSIARAWTRSDPSGAPIHSPTGLSTGRPKGARIIRRFSPAGKGSIQKLRMHNFRRKRSIVQKQKLMITAVSRHTHTHTYIYIICIYNRRDKILKSWAFEYVTSLLLRNSTVRIYVSRLVSTGCFQTKLIRVVSCSQYIMTFAILAS